MTDFVFVHVHDPKDALQLAKGSHIRSHIARQQWKQMGESSRKRSRKEHACPEFASSSTDVAIPRLLGGHRVDPFRSYPITWRPFLPQIVDHYLTTMAVDIPEIDQPGNRGLLRTSWFPLVMSEPALFLVTVLLAASNHASVQTQPTDQKMNLLRLRYEAVQAVNEALAVQLPWRLSDALVGAIAKMASYEAIFGTLDNYTIHMQGLCRAVELRGGLPSLGLDGLLRRIVLWIDRNGAFLNGSRLYFPGEMFAEGQPLPEPNPGHFLAAS